MGERFKEVPTPLLSFTALFITQPLESRLPDAGTTYKNVCNVIEYVHKKLGCRHPKVLLLFQDV
jgi:hypothetical protein